ncbi:unnamed protein product [Mucor hiemalis]
MFEPTIKYRRVNNPPPPKKDLTESFQNLDIAESVKDNSTTNNSQTKVVEKQDEKESPSTDKLTLEKASVKDAKDEPIKEDKIEVPAAKDFDYTFEEEEDDCKIEVDPQDKERIIVTLSTGKQFSADRYCPHAGADLSYHGKVSEHDYPPEIGPILMCPIHYWEFALEKGGKGGGGWATINACPIEVAEKCNASPEKKKLDW